MNNDAKTPDHRRLVDRIGDAMRHAIKNGREEFTTKMEVVRELVIEAEVAEDFDPRSDDEFRDWLNRRYGKTKKRIPTSRLTA